MATDKEYEELWGKMITNTFLRNRVLTSYFNQKKVNKKEEVLLEEINFKSSCIDEITFIDNDYCIIKVMESPFEGYPNAVFTGAYKNKAGNWHQSFSYYDCIERVIFGLIGEKAENRNSQFEKYVGCLWEKLKED